MSRACFIILMGIEAYIGFFSMLMMFFSWDLWREGLAVLLVFAVLMALLIRRLKRQKQAGDEKAVQKTRTHIVLCMLLPIIPAFIIVVMLVLTLALYG